MSFPITYEIEIGVSMYLLCANNTSASIFIMAKYLFL